MRIQQANVWNMLRFRCKIGFPPTPPQPASQPVATEFHLPRAFAAAMSADFISLNRCDFGMAEKMFDLRSSFHISVYVHTTHAHMRGNYQSDRRRPFSSVVDKQQEAKEENAMQALL